MPLIIKKENKYSRYFDKYNAPSAKNFYSVDFEVLLDCFWNNDTCILTNYIVTLCIEN